VPEALADVDVQAGRIVRCLGAAADGGTITQSIRKKRLGRYAALGHYFVLISGCGVTLRARFVFQAG
jgi:hypothetical protein